jgi:DNA-directed RNA polymerase subunit RPC12/RpoP
MGATQGVFCGECGVQLDESPSRAPESRVACPECGSTRRRFAVAIEDTIKIRESLRVRAKAGGKGKPFQEEKVGDDFWEKGGRWMTLRRLFDRRRNRYVERIEDPETGEVIRDVDEPLSDHRGHGDARRKRR